MSRKEKVLVIFDAAGKTKIDQDYSEELKTKDWETEAHVLKALTALGYPFETLGIYDDVEIILEKIKQYEPDIIFNLVESFRSVSSHDRDIAALLKLQDIPFTGCGPTGMTLCKNKGLSKKILSYHKIRVPDFVILPQGKKIQRPKRLEFPIFIKPLKEEASTGISQASFVENDEEFNTRVTFIHETLKQDVIAEEYIEGRELYCSILGNGRLQALPLREIKFIQVPDDEPKFASYKAKWDEQYRKRWGIRNQFPGSLPNGSADRIAKICKRVFRLLHIRGYARFDLRLTPAGDIVFIEANPNPILSKGEDFAESASKAGIDYPQMIERIIQLAKTEDVD